MGLEIKRRSTLATTGLVADRRLYLTRERDTVVEEGSMTAAELLAVPGTVIPAEECARLGLSLVAGRIVQGVAGNPPAAQPESSKELGKVPSLKGADKRSAGK